MRDSIIRKRDWPKTDNDNETGIQLRAGQQYWGYTYIGLGIHEELFRKIEEQQVLSKRLAELISMEPKHKHERLWPMWEPLKYYSNVPEDWSKAEFCKKALVIPEQLVNELTTLLKEWANMEKTQRILSVVESVCSE